MEKFVIKGPVTLQGKVKVNGAKNAALPILAAALLSDKRSVIRNVPRLSDISTMLEILEYLGARCAYLDANTVEIDPKGVCRHDAPYEYVRRMRASVCLLGALLGRFGKAKVSLPGGCIIGPRPIDLHIKGLAAIGAEMDIEHGYVIAGMKQSRKESDLFLGGRFGSSVLATANVIMAAVTRPGRVRIESAACEPEIIDLIDFLKDMGAHITGAGSPTVTVEGVKTLHGADHEIIPDRIEAATLMIGAAVTKGSIEICGARHDHLHAVSEKLREAGAHVRALSKGVRVSASCRPHAVDLTTHPYPGFPTDVQAQMMTLMCLSDGISVITEKIYPERFMHISELNRFGADISLEGSTAIVKGKKRLSGAPVMASDLRASAALVLAGLAAGGITEVNRIYHLDRGYERLDEKLNTLGASIERVPQESA